MIADNSSLPREIIAKGGLSQPIEIQNLHKFKIIESYANYFNMLTLYFFGRVVEQYFAAVFGSQTGILLYVILYVSALAVSTVGDLFKFRNNPLYSAVGASGAVSAVLFASILFEPKMGIYIYLIPIPVPGFVFAPLYLLYCWYMAKRGTDNIGHSAHLWGAVYGLVFPLICNPAIFKYFLSQF